MKREFVYHPGVENQWGAEASLSHGDDRFVPVGCFVLCHFADTEISNFGPTFCIFTSVF